MHKIDGHWKWNCSQKYKKRLDRHDQNLIVQLNNYFYPVYDVTIKFRVFLGDWTDLQSTTTWYKFVEWTAEKDSCFVKAFSI